MLPRMVRPDAKGRITLGHLAEGISGFSISITSDRKIILEPYTEIPAREKWLFDNQLALGKLKQGIKDAAAGRLSDKGSFAQFANDDSE